MKKIALFGALLLGLFAGVAQVSAAEGKFDIEKMYLQKLYAGRTAELGEYARYLFLTGLNEDDWGKVMGSFQYYEVLVDKMDQIEFADEYLEVLIICKREDGLSEFYKSVCSFDGRHGHALSVNSKQIVEYLKSSLSKLLVDDVSAKGSNADFLRNERKLRQQISLEGLELAIFKAVNAREYYGKDYLNLILRRELSRISIEDDPGLYYYTEFNLALLEDNKVKMKEAYEKLAGINSKFTPNAKLMLLRLSAPAPKKGAAL